jgi:hypothetical protein
MIAISHAILALNPTAQVSVNDEDLSQIIWHDDNPTSITTEQIQTKLTELRSVESAQAYARKRADEYPSTKDFMEAYTEKEIGGDSAKWDVYVIKYNKVRTDNPK